MGQRKSTEADERQRIQAEFEGAVQQAADVGARQPQGFPLQFATEPARYHSSARPAHVIASGWNSVASTLR